MGIRIKKIIRIWIVSYFILSPLLPAVSSGGRKEPITVLYVNSYHPGYAWSDGILDGIRSVLKDTHDVTLIVEYLYTKTHQSDVYFQKVQDVFREKYGKNSVDAIITSDDHALDFVLKIRNELFRGIPLIFCGVDHVTPERMAGHDRVYEIKQGKATKATIDLALKLQPTATDIYFIGDTSKTGKTTVDGALELEPHYKKNLAFHYFQNYSVDELIDELKNIPSNAIAIYLTFLKDKTGKVFSLSESMTLVSQNIKAPVYCTWGFQPKLGIVGGAIMNGFKQGEFSAEQALRIVNSENLKGIPKSQTAPLAYLIDYKAFQSHGLDIKSLPESSTVFNKPPSIYDDYKKYRAQVWSVIVVVVILFAFVLLLRDRASKLASTNKKLSLEMDERKRMAEALRASEEKFRTFFMLGKVGMAITSPEKGWIRVNHQLCDMLGYSEAELSKTTWPGLTHPGDLAADETQFNRVLNGEIDGYSLDKRFIRKDGTAIHTTLWVAGIRNEDGAVEHFIVHLSDNTERVKAEKEKESFQAHLRQQQKMESIGTLAGGVAHEINNPINGIMNYAQLILDKTKKEDPAAEFAGEIIHETQRVADIVRNLLTFARQEKEHHSPARIQDIIGQTLSLIQTVIRRDQITINVDISENLPEIKCRSQQIQQIVMNVLINARDALNERYPAYDKNKIVSIFSNLVQKDGRKWIRTTIEDHGQGIPQEVRNRIFDPFFTTKPKDKGTGLGLSISYGIVKDHHGDLTFESEPGAYTRFHMDLPVDDD